MKAPKTAAPRSVHQSVSAELIDLDGVATPVDAELQYHRDDPYAMTAVFATSAWEVRWTFARDLLNEGVYEPTGDGDVHVWPCLDQDGRAVVIIELCSPRGEALLQLPSGEMSRFVQRTAQCVQLGEEAALLDVDAAISQILAAAGG